MPAYQTNYGERMAPNGPGIIAGNMDNARVATGICETAAPGIGFGLAVSQGSLSDAGVILGGSLAGLRGCSVRDITLSASSPNVDKYQAPNSMGVLESGEIWAEPNAAVAANDPVWFNSVTGVWGKATGTNMLGPVKGARWKTSCGVGGRAILSLPDYKRAD